MNCRRQKGADVERAFSKYIIVGGSAAGMAAANAIREHDQRGAITVLSEEPDPPYFRPMIPFLVSGEKKASGMMLKGNGPYTERDIDVKTETHVTAVNTDDRVVLTEAGSEIVYEKILFSTGSRPYIPSEIEGTDSDGVFTLRTLDDARKMARCVESTTHAVMLGGGLLNLKTAFSLLQRGVKVTLVVYSPEVLSQLMDPADAGIIRKALDEAGLQIKTGCKATAIQANGTGVSGVAMDDGSEMPCELICIGKGVLANVTYLDDSNIQINKGILVDRFTECNIPGTYGAGDVAVTFNPITGERMMTALWTNAVEMGRCAGLNMAGIKTAYSGTFGVLNATQVAAVPFVSMGVVHTVQDDLETYIYATDDIYRKVVFNKKGTQLIGAVFVGDISNAGLYRYVIRERIPVAGIKSQIIDHVLHYGHFLNRAR
jgi:NAD(P)H-nitrite reductase large subunit